MKKRLISILLMNLCICAVMCAAGQLLGIIRGEIPRFSLPRYGLNLVVVYPLSCLASLLIPSEKFGAWVCRILGLKPGPLYGVVMGCSISLIFTLVFSTIMTWFNAVLLAKRGLHVLIPGILRDYLPMWLVSSLVSGLIRQPIERLAAQKQPSADGAHKD